MKKIFAPWLWFFLLWPRIITAEEAPPKRWEIIAVGDIMLGRGVSKTIERHGPGYPLAKMPLVTDSCQVLCGNLESVISSEEFKSQSPYRFKADPVVADNILKQNGFGFLSVANNHAYDCGPSGLEESLGILDSLRIPYSGILEIPKKEAGAERVVDSSAGKKTCRPAYMKIGDVRVCFLAFCQPYLLNPNNENNIIAPADSTTICNSIQAVKDSCQVIITSFHWGFEYHHQPSKAQKYLGRLAIRAGAGIVLGHHPHVLQGIELYKDGVIAYSLGNFIFDQRDSLANQSAVLHMIMKGSQLDSLWLEPIEIRAKRPTTVNKSKLNQFKRLIDELNLKLKTSSRIIEDRLYLF
jgi:poly-gamma-glutamate synthesis protein (capsule biosynthesis protein)